MRPLPSRRHGLPSGWVQPWWIWLEGNQRSATVRVLPGVNHLGLVVNERAAEEIEAWLTKLP